MDHRALIGETRHIVPKRVLGTWQAASVVVGMVVGAGIFRTAPLVAQGLSSDNAVLLAWTLGGLFALIGALCYAELASTFPDQGGDYRFLREAFGRDLAFLFAWSRFSVIFTASAAMLAFVGVDYLAQLFPMADGARAGLAALTIVTLTGLNLRGLQTGTRTQVALVTLDVVALLTLGVAAALLVALGAAPAAAPVDTDWRGGFGASMVFIMLAYGGFNDAATLSAEVRRPRDMTRALVGGMAAVTALYLLANWAYLSGLGLGGLAASDAPAATLMRLAFGRAGEAAMVLCVAVATLAVLNALVIVGGRTLYAAAEDEPALARLADWDLRRGVPRAAILAQTAVALVLVLWGARTGRGFATMVDYLAPVYWLFLTLAGVAVIVLRRRRPNARRPYRVPLFPLLPLLFSAGSAFILVASIRFVGWTGCAVSFGVLGAGFAVRALLRAIHAR